MLLILRDNILFFVEEKMPVYCHSTHIVNDNWYSRGHTVNSVQSVQAV